MKDQITYNTHGTCSRQIILEVENNIVTNISFVGGCSGNTQGICALVIGMNVEDVIKRLRGIKCGFKPTSCPDQLAQALEQYQKDK